MFQIAGNLHANSRLKQFDENDVNGSGSQHLDHASVQERECLAAAWDVSCVGQSFGVCSNLMLLFSMDKNSARRLSV